MKYPYEVFQAQVEAHAFWVAKSTVLRGCVGQGDTLTEAVSELEENEVAWLETAEECGISIPPVPVIQETEYSGKFTVRISPSVHEEATKAARAQGISLNQYVNDAILTKNERQSILQMIQQSINDVVKEIQINREILFSSTRSASEGQNVQTIKRMPILIPQNTGMVI